MTLCPLKEWIILSFYVQHHFCKEDQWITPSHPHSRRAVAGYACSSGWDCACGEHHLGQAGPCQPGLTAARGRPSREGDVGSCHLNGCVTSSVSSKPKSWGLCLTGLPGNVFQQLQLCKRLAQGSLAATRFEVRLLLLSAYTTVAGLLLNARDLTDAARVSPL